MCYQDDSCYIEISLLLKEITRLSIILKFIISFSTKYNTKFTDLQRNSFRGHDYKTQCFVFDKLLEASSFDSSGRYSEICSFQMI